MLDCYSDRPRVVETREPATETTLEDVLARNLPTHGALHLYACAASAPLYLVFYYCADFVARASGRRSRNKKLSMALGHVDGTQRLAGPRVQSGPPREKPLLLFTERSST